MSVDPYEIKKQRILKNIPERCKEDYMKYIQPELVSSIIDMLDLTLAIRNYLINHNLKFSKQVFEGGFLFKASKEAGILPEEATYDGNESAFPKYIEHLILTVVKDPMVSYCLLDVDGYKDFVKDYFSRQTSQEQIESFLNETNIKTAIRIHGGANSCCIC